MAKKKSYKVGDTVSWESASGSGRTKKTGKVVKVLKPHDPNRRAAEEPFRETHRIMFDGLARDHESYWVEVPGGKTARAKPRLYWPLVQNLRKVRNG